MKVLVTGANGFVGQAVCRALTEKDHHVIAATRSGIAVPGAEEARPTGDLANSGDWDHWVAGVDTVVHLAARAHVTAETAANPLLAFRRINVAPTQQLAEAAARQGVRRLVFLSSVKVNGEATGDRPFTEDDAPNPGDPYGLSKWEAEQALAAISSRDGLEIVVLRPPLVYGPGVKANFLSLLRLCDMGLPLPFGGITDNKRSLINVDNLADAICVATEHPGAAGRTCFVSDGKPISTTDLIHEIRAALGRQIRLFPLPPALLRGALVGIGKGDAADRLLGSLAIDDSLIRKLFDWHAPVSLQTGMAKTAHWYRASLMK